MKMWMTNIEKECFLSLLKPEDDYLEWGSGGSTLEVLTRVKSIVSIEHDSDWYYKLKKKLELMMDGDKVDYRLVCPNSPRSFPFVKKEEFLHYINEVHTIGKRYDKVLIDGRARIWCAEEVRKYLKPNSLVFIHDWDRIPYHKVIEWYKLVGLRQRMAVLRLK